MAVSLLSAVSCDGFITSMQLQSICFQVRNQLKAIALL